MTNCIAVARSEDAAPDSDERVLRRGLHGDVWVCGGVLRTGSITFEGNSGPTRSVLFLNVHQMWTVSPAQY